MTDLFAMEFFRNAFLMSLLLAFLFGVLSFFVVLRKMTFLGAGIAHTAFGGVALGVVLGLSPFFSSLIFCILASLLIARMTESGKISYDTGIGIFFSFSMALGALLIALQKSYTFDLSGYLFGNILGSTGFDLIVTLVTTLLFGTFIGLNFQRLLFISFDERVARVSGVPVTALNTLLLITLAVIIVVSIKIVGIILVSALIVLPASFALQFFNQFRHVLLVSILYTLVIMMGGLFLSYMLDTPTGATVVVLGTVLFFVGYTMKCFHR